MPELVTTSDSTSLVARPVVGPVHSGDVDRLAGRPTSREVVDRLVLTRTWWHPLPGPFTHGLRVEAAERVAGHLSHV